MLEQELNCHEDIIKSLLDLIPQIPNEHSPLSPIYKYLSKTSCYSSRILFGEGQKDAVDFGKIGKLKLPYFSMGEINSTHLFGLDELILFSFYIQNSNRYKKVADLGANIGLHSIILTKLGFEVTSYEPDKIHFSKINDNVSLNCDSNKPKIINKAISTKKGEIEFIRINDNSTGSHISGAKESFYGDVEKITVKTDCFKEIINKFDFLKIDVEGHEAEILLTTSHEDWENTDAMIEVGSPKNSAKIFEFFKSININLFSQKKAWRKVLSIDDMPYSYKDGSLFISIKENVPWEKI